MPTTFSPEERTLTDAIAADPDADGPRLAYARWLESRDDPRGEFIRLEVELARMSPEDPLRPDLDARRNELLEEHQEEWAQPFRDLGLSMEFYGRTVMFFERGLVESVWVDAPGVFPEQAARLFALAPGLVEISFQDSDPVDLAALAACPQVARLRALDLGSKEVTAAGLRVLLGSPHLGGLRELDLGHNDLGPEGARVLGDGPMPPRLERLLLRHAGFGPVSGRDLARMGLPHLRVLDLSSNPIGPEGLAPLLAALFLARLHTLKLASADLGPEGVEALADRLRLDELVELDLEGNDLTADGALALARWPALATVRRLTLNNNLLEDEGVGNLIASPHLAALERLDLGYNDLGPGSGEILSAWKALQPATFLKLNQNHRLGDAGVTALARSPLLANLTELDLYEVGLGSEGARALAGAAFAPVLRELSLVENAIGQAGAEALAAGTWPALTSLRLSALQVGDDGEAVLRRRFEDLVDLS